MTNLLSLQLNGNSINDWMSHYGHKLENGQIKVNGELTSIEEAALKVLNSDTKKISSNWRYDHEGLSEKSFIKFRELSPTNKHASDGKNYLVIKTKEKGFLGMSRHTYMELIDTNGNGYEVGFCGPTAYPFFGTRGAIVSPDPKEASSGKERKIYVEITDEQFENLHKRITTDKQEGHEYFQLFQNNCSRFVTRICKEHLGLKINNKEFFSQAITRKALQYLNIKPSNLSLKVLNIAAKVLRVLLSPVLGLVWILSGAAFDNKLGKDIKEKQFPNQPSGVKEVVKRFFKSEYIKPFTGWKISVWQDKVKETFGSDHVTLEQAKSIQFNELVAI
jgi:hypothetical protein